MYLELTEWRRAVAGLYALVRAAAEPVAGHRVWIQGRDELFRNHPQSPLAPTDPLRDSGLPYWPYDPALRFTAALAPPDHPRELVVPTGDGDLRLRLAGRVTLPAPIDRSVSVWWLDQYGGGLFLPLRDGTAGKGSYGGGRYLLDTVKGADLGGTGAKLVLDLNFLYHPSCRYSPEWSCPLAPDGNRIDVPVTAGERMPT